MKSTDPTGWGCAPWRAIVWLLALVTSRARAFMRNHVDRSNYYGALKYYVYVGDRTFAVILGPKCPACHGEGGWCGSEIEPGYDCWYCGRDRRVTPWRWAWYYVRYALNFVRHFPQWLWYLHISPALERRRAKTLDNPHWPNERPAPPERRP